MPIFMFLSAFLEELGTTYFYESLYRCYCIYIPGIKHELFRLSNLTFARFSEEVENEEYEVQEKGEAEEEEEEAAEKTVL